MAPNEVGQKICPKIFVLTLDASCDVIGQGLDAQHGIHPTGAREQAAVGNKQVAYLSGFPVWLYRRVWVAAHSTSAHLVGREQAKIVGAPFSAGHGRLEAVPGCRFGEVMDGLIVYGQDAFGACCGLHPDAFLYPAQ